MHDIVYKTVGGRVLLEEDCGKSTSVQIDKCEVADSYYNC